MASMRPWEGVSRRTGFLGNRPAPPVVRLLASARLQLGDQDSLGWVKRLRWDREVRVQRCDLPTLDPQGIEDLLRTSGAPVNVLASRPDVIRRLQKLSQGEPLLLRLYVEDLWQRKEDALRLTLEVLDRINPGLRGYFEDWVDRQREAWEQEGREEEKLGIFRFREGKCFHAPALRLSPMRSPPPQGSAPPR